MRLGGGLGRAALGVLVSVVALALVAGAVDLTAAAAALRDADPRWIALLAGCVVADVGLRVVRWRVLLGPVGGAPARAVTAALLVGYLANNVLPARLGELVRAHALGARTGLARSTILGTVVVERIADTAVVVAIAALAILVLSVRGVVASAVLAGFAVTALLALGVAVLVAAHRLPGAGRLRVLADRNPRVAAPLRRLRDGLAVARRPRTLLAALALSVGSWSCTVVGFAAAAQAVGVPPTTGQAALLAAGTNLATAVPAGPGYVGTFELAAVAIGRSVALPPAAILAAAILVHAATLLLTSAGGAAALLLGARAGARERVAP